MDQRNHCEHHTLISRGEVIQHLTGLLPLLLQVIGHHSRKVIVVVLPPLPVGHVRLHSQQAVLHFPHSLICGDRDNVNGQHEASVQAGQLLDH